MKKKIIALSTLIFALTLTACGTQGTPATSGPTLIPAGAVIAEGHIRPVKAAVLAFEPRGTVQEILVKQGDSVKKGQPLIRLGDASDANYAAAQLELVSAQKALNDLLNSSGADLAQAVIDLKQAKEDYDKADDYLRYLQNSRKVPQSETKLFLETKRNSWMYVYKTKTFRGPAPEDWIIEAQNDLALKKAELDEAQRTYDRMKGGADEDQLKVLEARLDAAKAGVTAFEVIAPFDGVVADVSVHVGDQAGPETPAVSVADFDQWVVETDDDVTELEVVKLKVGQAVTMVPDALPDITINGTVESISQSFTKQGGDILYTVRIKVEAVDPRIMWGMTVEVTFPPK